MPVQDESPRRPFRWLLRLLPFDFRSEFGEEIEATFDEQRAEVWVEGRRRSALLWLRTARDTVRLAFTEHWDLLRQDLKFGARTLRRSPGFTSVAVVTLALGIGAVTAIFTVVDAVVFRPLPYQDPDRLVHLETTQQQSGGFDARVFSYPQFEDVRNQATAFARVAAWRGMGTAKAAGNRAELVAGRASSDFLAVLGVKTVLGRAFNEADETADARPVALITHRTWINLYGSDPAVIGRILTNEGDPPRPVTIVGVLEPGFDFPRGLLPVAGFDVWLAVTPDARSPAGAVPRGSRNWSVIARLKEGVRLEAAERQLDTIAARLAAAYPEAHKNEGLAVMSLQDKIVGGTRLPLLAFLGAVWSLLLIACVNVANLLLARARTRERELGIRLALGAGRLRVARQLLTETALLSFAGAAAGLALAWWGVGAFVAFSPYMPRLDEARIDDRVLAFTLVVVALTAISAGLVPALRCSSRSAVQALTHASGAPAGRHSGRHALGSLVIAELALALVLLVGGGLMVSSLVHMLRTDLGFDPRGVLAVDIAGTPTGPGTAGDLSSAAAREQEKETGVVVLTGGSRWRARIDEELSDRISSLPGVTSACLSRKAPFRDGRGMTGIRIQGRPDRPGEQLAAETAGVTPGCFEALTIPLVEGRLFDERDSEGAPRVAIVNETLARLGWPGTHAIGQSVALGYGGWARIVGVVRDGLQQGPTDRPVPELYFPDAQYPGARTVLIKLARTRPSGLTAAVARVIQEVNSGLNAGQARLLEDALWELLTPPRFMTFILAAFSLLALVLALVGIHGVLAYSVVKRTREIGIRMALGGSRSRVMGLVLMQAARYAFVGLVLGLSGGVAVGRLGQALLFEVTPADPLTLAGVSLLFFAGVMVAAAGPARRATGIDPMTCLKDE